MKTTVAIVYNTSEYAYKFKQDLIAALKRNHYDVVVFAPLDRYSAKLAELGVKYVELEMDRKGENPLAELLLIGHFVKLFKQEAPNIFLTFTIKPNLYGSIAAGLLAKPAICNVTGLGTVFIKGGLSLVFAKLLYKLGFTFSKKVFFQNIEDKTLFEEQNLVNAKKSELLPGDGVDIGLFNPSYPRSVNDNKLRFLFIGRILKDKGIMEYVGAAKIITAKYPETEFQILGGVDEGNPTAISLKEVQQWQTDGIIKYLDHVDDIRPHLANADVVVLPSYREGMPRTILEASSMGKPVIVTDVPGCRHAVVHGETGYLCKVQDIGSLVEAIETMIQDGAEKRRAMGQKSRKRIEAAFDEKIVTAKYLDTITELLDNKHP